MQLSVVSHNTQKGVVRRKLCRFSSKLSPEMLSFVSYACLKFCVRKQKEEERREKKEERRKKKEERRKKKKEERRRIQNWRFHCEDFLPHGYSNVHLLVFFVNC